VAVRVESEPIRVDWKSGRVAGWLTTVDHKRIGILYIATSLVFFAVGGLLSLLMRAQLATPNENFITRDSYNELVTVHGTTMVFLVVVPILTGLGNYLVPLMIGARDMAFPRLNALSYWLFLFGGIVLYSSFVANGGPANCGWTCYAPLSENAFSPGNGVDLWILSLHLLSLGSLAGAINFVATIVNMRTPGCASRSSSGRCSLSRSCCYWSYRRSPAA
jgi:cytochrome c oxidase subunit 1